MRKRELSTRSKKMTLEMTALDRKEKGVLPTGVSKRIAVAEKPTLIEDERRMRAEARMEKMRSTGQMDQVDARGRTNRREAFNEIKNNRPAKLPSMSDHANRRPSNMWEIAIAEIHKEKHPDARVVPQLTPRARRQTRTYETERQQTFEAPLFDDAPTTNNAYYRPDRQTRLSHDLQHAPTQQGPTAETLKAIGEVTQVYAKINVAVLRLDDALSVGDTITYQTAEGSHTQTVLSMEIDRKPIFKANPGDEVGIKLYKTALVGKVVYAQQTT